MGRLPEWTHDYLMPVAGIFAVAVLLLLSGRINREMDAHAASHPIERTR
jgi:hypothetical protein